MTIDELTEQTKNLEEALHYYLIEDFEGLYKAGVAEVQVHFDAPDPSARMPERWHSSR
jgi:hypothetical protein